ncbi:MAG: DEAD/DEAH box helicase [Myxococcota bacterium]|nr:DEAD/DEAH box helicase [Myxococcota bacterium]
MQDYQFHSITKTWFAECFNSPTPAQDGAWKAIANGNSTLLMAPTGSGKTLAAFLYALDRMMFSSADGVDRGRILYISPIKALAVDVERNLRSPLTGLATVASRKGQSVNPIQVGVRTGDTSQRDRLAMVKNPPDILITTPESLYLMLTSKAASILEAVDTIIIDEIHAIAGSKRGTHLFLSLERLEALTEGEHTIQRIGLSATQRPLDEVAQLLGGFQRVDGQLRPRPVEIVDVKERKSLQLSIEVPTADMVTLDDIDFESETFESPDVGVTSAGQAKSIWPILYPKIIDKIRAHRTTLIFVNSRRTAERLANAINDVAKEDLARAHHGSLAHAVRMDIEDQLKRGLLPAIVATASLELGIDMGAVDLVIQVESPPSIASGLQRIGRAQHHVGGVPIGVTYPKFRADLIPCATAHSAMLRGAIEATRYLRNPLDVLAQQIVAIISMHDHSVDTLFELIQGAAPYAELSKGLFESVLDMLSGRYPSDDFSDLRPRITWDRLTGQLTARKGAKRLAILNGGTIPERGLYGVFLLGDEAGRSRRVGELDEEMVFESRVGEVFLLGASSWRIEEITHEKVLVTPAPGEPGKMPFWHGDRPGRPYEFGLEVGGFLRMLDELNSTETDSQPLQTEYTLDSNARLNLLNYVGEQREHSAVPTDKRLVLERFVDELGDWRVCLLSPFGGRVHAPWAMAVRTKLMDEYQLELDAVWSDDGIVFRLPFGEDPPDAQLFFPSPEDVEPLLIRRLAESALFAARFRENAGRALLLPKKKPGGRTPLWAIRRRAASLLSVAARFNDFPIILETYRECLRDQFEIESLQDVLRKIENRHIKVVDIQSDTPSPFSTSLMFEYVANFMYEGDAPLAERRAHALTIDQSRLRELLGTSALRELLAIEAIEELNAVLQRLDTKLKAEDDLHDLLLSLGPQFREEIEARTADTANASELIATLIRHRRIIDVVIGGHRRLAAAEDSARLRDALGTVIPPGLPSSFLEPVADPMGDLVSRYARRRGPFTARQLASHYGLGLSVAQTALQPLIARGRIIEGEFLPGSQGTEYCDADVLKRLKRLSLARLRADIKSVEHSVFSRFTLAWHGLDQKQRGPDALLDVVDQLQGAPLPASVLESDILSVRLHDYQPSDLDQLLAHGEVVWVGLRSTGVRDGRIALFTMAHLDLLAPVPTPLDGEIYDEVRRVLNERGALFFKQLSGLVGGFPERLLEAVWDLVWNGEVSNDSLVPLRRMVRPPQELKKQRRRAYRLRPSRHHSLPGSEGRWWLVDERRSNAPNQTDRRMALAQQLLERHGIITREAAASEQLDGGFSSVYPVFKALEESGRIRRGYFVEGLGLTQFAVPGADDQLRQGRTSDTESSVLLLATTDPANPFGAALPWPDDFSGRPERSPGSRVAIMGGRPIAFISRSGRSLHTRFSQDIIERRVEVQGLCQALRDFAQINRIKVIYIEQINGELARDSSLTSEFIEHGFRPTGDAIRLTTSRQAGPTDARG